VVVFRPACRRRRERCYSRCGEQHAGHDGSPEFNVRRPRGRTASRRAMCPGPDEPELNG
jgi:hypothetical protein